MILPYTHLTWEVFLYWLFIKILDKNIINISEFWNSGCQIVLTLRFFTKEILLLFGVSLSTVYHCLALLSETLANKEGMLSCMFPQNHNTKSAI